MKGKRLFIFNLLIAFCFFLITGCAAPPEEESAMIYHYRDFDLSVQYKQKYAFGFSADKNLGQRIDKKTGDGSPENPFIFGVEIANRGDKEWTGVVKVALSINRKDVRFFLPGYLYGNNNAGSDLPPRLIKEFQRLRKGPESIPFSPYWYMRSDQLTHPVAAMFADGRMWAISGSPYLTNTDPLTCWEPGDAGFAGYNGFYCSVEKNAETGFTLGYVNYPGIYASPWEYTVYNAGQQGCVSIQAGATVKFDIRVFSFASGHEDGLGKVIETVYEAYHESPVKKDESGIREAATDLSRAISKDAYNPLTNGYTLITMNPVSSFNKTYEMKNRFSPGDYQANNEGLIGWTNGAAIAAPLLEASYRLGDPASRSQAVKVIDEIVGKSVNPATGIPFCAKVDGKWTNQGWWTQWITSEGVKPGHSSYIVAQSLYYILKAYEVEKNHGQEHASWLAFVGNVIETVSKTRDENGAFPRFWDEATGAGTEYDAFSGCWVTAAMAYYAKLASRKDLLPAVLKSEAHYYEDVARMECSKTPLDVADAPDSEGVLAYIRLTKILSELVEKKPGDGVSYLDRMRTGIDYALSFTFCYNVPYLSPPLGSLQWSTSGGSITSVENAVIHCMLNSILDELNYYYKQTGDEYYGKRLADIYDWGLQVFNRSDCQFFFGKTGWSSKFFCQAERYMMDILLTDGTRSSIWFAYHPWATAAVLEGICGDMWKE